MAEENKYTIEDLKNYLEKENIEYLTTKQSRVECEMLKRNLEQLVVQLGEEEKKKGFADFFVSASVGAFCRYRSSKTKTWGKKHNIFLMLAAAIVPLLSTVTAAWLGSGEGYLAGTSTVVTSMVLTLGVLSVAYIEWSKKKNDKETWVRHSSCFSRLNLLLQRYILSNQTESDYQFLVESTFAILEQNLDQFVLNLSTNGLAERAEVEWQESECDQEDNDQEESTE